MSTAIPGRAPRPPDPAPIQAPRPETSGHGGRGTPRRHRHRIDAHHWWQIGRFIESTDDAYLGADVITMAPKVCGFNYGA